MEEISFLTATVSRLDTEIARLNQSRAALLRRLNQVRPSTRCLPPETLALIFHHASHHFLSPQTTPDFGAKKPLRTSPLVLGSVCSYWRQIAWSTPVLWTYIDPVPIRRNAQLSDAHLLRLYFANARALPVSLQIKLDRLSSSPSAASEEILRAVFIENSINIRVLVCSSKSSLRQRWAMLAPKLSHADFSNLERLEINLRGAPLSRYDSPMFVHAPRLWKVSFSGYHLPHETFWEHITVLELNGLPVSQCLETLVKCPRLVEFRCTSPRQSHRSLDFDGHTTPSTVSLDHLSKFEWAGALADWDVYLYSVVRLPNLRHLILGNSHPLSRPIEPAPGDQQQQSQPPRTTDPDLWKRFLRHVKSLSILECNVFHSAHEWLDIFDIFGSTLDTLKFTAYRDPEETLKLLRALQLAYDQDQEQIEEEEGGEERGRTTTTTTRRNYLPNLKSISATLDSHPDRSNLMLDILCSRRLRPIVYSLSSESTTTTTTATTTTPDNASTTSSSSTLTSETIPTTLSPSSSSSSLSKNTNPDPLINPNDYLLNPRIDDDYWKSHTRLEEAIIKCWPFSFDFNDREKKLAKLLKQDAGLKLDVFGQTSRVDWL